MAHFAKVNQNNVVEQVIVIANEFENDGENYITQILGLQGRWIQTSYNNKIRNHFAGVGMNYDDEADVFYPAQPHKGWILDKTNWSWNSPKPYPGEGFEWNDDLEDWVQIGKTL